MICISSILKSVLTAVHTQWRWSAACTYNNTSLVPSGPQTRQKGRSSVLLTAPGERFQNMHCTSTSIKSAVFVTRIKTSGQESCLKHTVTHQGTEAVLSQMKWTQQDSSAVVTSHFYSVKSRLKKIHKGQEVKFPSFQPSYQCTQPCYTRNIRQVKNSDGITVSTQMLIYDKVFEPFRYEC